MVITLSVVMCLGGQCMTRSIMDSLHQPEMTMMGCLTQGAPSVAQYVSNNYPGARVVKWQCAFGNRKPIDRPDM